MPPLTDEYLLSVANRLAPPHWALLQLLTCDDEGNLLPQGSLEPTLLSEILSKTTFHPQSFRVHMAFLEGAGAVEIKQDHIDSRRRPASVTPDGYRLMELYIENGGNI